MPRTLSEADADLFYQLFFPLLGYVNEKHRIVPGLRHIMPGMSIRAEDAKEIADKLWEDPGLIDRYLEERTLPEDRRSILLSWKKRRKDEFFVERHLAKGSIFIDPHDSSVYQVCGIRSDWEEMLDWCPLPVLVHAVLIPFRDVIITDGLVFSEPMLFGPGVRSMLKETYMEAKSAGEVIRTLE